LPHYRESTFAACRFAAAARRLAPTGLRIAIYAVRELAVQDLARQPKALCGRIDPGRTLPLFRKGLPVQTNLDRNC
jgi:hypothetical protein